MFNVLDNLDLYIKNKLNCILIGRHGVGKSTILLQLFEKHFPNNYLYFSTSTLDPWCDLIGIPREQTNQKGEMYLDLLRPKFFENDSLEAIIFDEVNRSPSKVRNAIMELIQFRSINGHKFHNLKVICACMNPEDDKDYDTEKLDKAFFDRFHIQIELPYLLDKDYFINKFGKVIADSAIEWWDSLEESVRYNISPRRLDYALEVWNIKGNLKDVLPKNSNISKLLENLRSGTIAQRVEKLLKEKDDAKIASQMDVNITSFIKKNLNNVEYIEKFVKFFPEEFILQEAPNNYHMCQHIKNNRQKFDITLLSTLDAQGLFKESDFIQTFNLMNAAFPDGKYSSKKKTPLEKILKYLPDVNTAKIRTGDVPQIIKLLQLIAEYISSSQSQTIENHEKQFRFKEKLVNLRIYNENKNLGIPFNDFNLIPLNIVLDEFCKQNKIGDIACDSNDSGEFKINDSLNKEIPGFIMHKNTILHNPNPKSIFTNITS